MKKLITFAILLLGWLSILSQSASDNDSIYLLAIEKYIVELDSFYMQHSHEPYERKDIIFLEKTDWLPNIPSTIKGVEIVLLDENWKDIYRRNSRELIHLKIFPIEIDGNYIEVSLTPYHGKYKKRKLLLGISDWTIV